MRKGAKSFAGFSGFAVPAIVVFVLATGNTGGLLAFGGLFLLLMYTNRLDARSIREGRPQ